MANHFILQVLHQAKSNVKILNLILNERLHIREIADRLDCSPAKVLGCIKLFEQNGIVRVVDEKNRRVVQFNRENQLAKQILELIEMSQGKEKNFEENKEAADSCPVNVIHIVKKDTGEKVI